MATNPHQHYADHYTWSHPLTSGVIAHQDGAVSRLIEWSGLDMEMTTEVERDSAWNQLYTALNTLEVGYCAEFHWWREWDSQLADVYRAHGQHMVRGGEFAKALRDAQADHLAGYGMSNQVATVLTKLPSSTQGWLELFAPTAALSRQGKDAITLDEQAEQLAACLPGGALAGREAFMERVQQSYDRDRAE